MELYDQKCKPDSAVKQVSKTEVQDLMLQIPGWQLSENELNREFRFKNFRESMNFVNRVAEIANEQDHHPDITISYSKVKLILTTHKVGGLSMNDFILAAKIDRLAAPVSAQKAA